MKKSGTLLLFILHFCASTNAKANSELSFIDQMRNDHDIPYEASEGQVSRLAMLRELGTKYPMRDCTQYCKNATSPQSEACKLGAFGAIYMQTARQADTNRDQLANWEIQNASLNIQPYAYMKEFEAGIPCEESPFIKKFPTRQPNQGEGNIPITRLQICHAWRNYFEAVGHSIRHFSPAAKIALLGDHTFDEARAVNRDIDELQYLAWRAHSSSILGSIWDHYKELEYASVKNTIPKKEYMQLMGFSRVVGQIIPFFNVSSCANIEDVKHQVLPSCIKGTRDANGQVCHGEEPENLTQAINQGLLALLQDALATTDFRKVMNAFMSGLKLDPSSKSASCSEK